jgi:hypothetical protein
MNRSILTLGAAAALTFLAAGCAQNESTTADSTPNRPLNSRSTATDDLPLAVSAAVHREAPTAGITNVTRLSAETGEPLWRVTWIENGNPRSATYFIDGRKLPNPEPATATPAGAPVGTR